jgi:hypothetical protein
VLPGKDEKGKALKICDIVTSPAKDGSILVTIVYNVQCLLSPALSVQRNLISVYMWPLSYIVISHQSCNSFYVLD